MPENSLLVFAAFAAQTVGAAVIAVLLFGFVRQYGRSYLAHLTASWAALSVYQLCETTEMALARWWAVPTDSPGSVVVSMLAGVAGYLQIAWLGFAVFELLRRRPVPLRAARQIVIVFAMAGAVIELFTEEPRDAMVRAVVAAAVFLAAGWQFWAVRKTRGGNAFTLTAIAFAVYAAEQVHYAAASGFHLRYAPYLGMFDFLIQSMIGLAMIACLLEDEREAAELATVEIEHLAYHDALTGLPNRPLFMDRLIVALAQAGRGNHKLAVFFIDLDRFKDINDSLGHSTGDALLKSVAERIRRCIREGDTVARFGGDEFTLLIPRIDNIEDAAKIAQKVIETLRVPFVIGGRELFATTSIGIAISPGDGRDPETLVRNADAAMYRAKDQGRDGYQLYAPAMNARALERLAMENMLRKALSQRELQVYYQPVIDLANRRIAGLEALLRWHHPELGLLLPAHFIATAELSGLIIPIDGWVMLTACKQLRLWQHHIDPDLTVSVNLSARQFQQPDLVATVAQALEESGIDPATLELEITESNAMQDAERTIYTLRELKGLGVRISMDDFGTGYSSLNYLKQFPIDTLKLDQTFVRDMMSDSRDAAIVSAVIAMVHSLDLQVIAEGVETEEQLAFLRQQRCDRIQGFLFSAPVPADELERYLLDVRARSVAV